MAAPKKNQFWKLRSKHGRDKLFATPELLWEAACEYFDWCLANPLWEVDFRGGGAKRVRIPRTRPFTLSGLCLYLDCNSAYFRQFKQGLPDDDQDFSTVITRIEEVVYTQKFEGAAAGLFNANIISRDLGLIDKQNTDLTSKGEKIEGPTEIIMISSAEMSDEEIERYKRKYLHQNEED